MTDKKLDSNQTQQASDAPMNPKKEIKKSQKELQQEELSEEDQELKSNIEMAIERISEESAGGQVAKNGIDYLIAQLKEMNSTMTSVPKPLKFLRPHYLDMKVLYEEKISDQELKKLLADIISLLASTNPKDSQKDTLKFCLLGTDQKLSIWGNEYIQHLVGEITAAYQESLASGEDVKELLRLVNEIVPFYLKHNSETDAVDLLLEIEQIDLIYQYMQESNVQRICLYLQSCYSYLPEPDNIKVLEVAYSIYLKFDQQFQALRIALKLNNREFINNVFAGCDDKVLKRQMGFLLARHGVTVDLDDGPTAIPDDDSSSDYKELLRQILGNCQLSEYFLQLARDLEVLEPKLPEDVYKTYLIEGRVPSSSQDSNSARGNLTTTFVNGFVNAGFCNDKLVTKSEEGEGEKKEDDKDAANADKSQSQNWIFSNKDHAKISAVASIGLIKLWDTDGGLSLLDKYLYSANKYVVAGALLGTGIVTNGIRHEHEPALPLLSEYVTKDDQQQQIGAIMGLGLAYAGTQKEELIETLLPILQGTETSLEVQSFTAISLALVFISSGNEEVVHPILDILIMLDEGQLHKPFAKFLCVALGLLYLGQQDAVSNTLEVAKAALNEKISKYCEISIESMAYAGTGNVLEVQKFLQSAGEHIQLEENDQQNQQNQSWKYMHQQAAVLGIAIVAMSEELGGEMAQRSLEHILQYGDQHCRQAVPLALALLNPSNPEINVIDTLSRLSHDANSQVVCCSILAMGILGAGTNNARLAGILRNLTSYYYMENSYLYVIRIAQGLVHLGKGLLTLNPYHTDKFLLSGVALAGLILVCTSSLDMQTTLQDQYHYMLYYIVNAIKPRMLLTVDEEGKMLPASVRVGQAVDVVAQAGRPKAITGFQTHTTPVLLGVRDRAELASDKYVSASPILEGVVILQKNEFSEETAE